MVVAFIAKCEDVLLMQSRVFAVLFLIVSFK